MGAGGLCGERGTSTEARDFQLAGSKARSGAPRALLLDLRSWKLVFLVCTLNPRKVTRPSLHFPLPTAVSSSRFALAWRLSAEIPKSLDRVIIATILYVRLWLFMSDEPVILMDDAKERTKLLV